MLFSHTRANFFMFFFAKTFSHWDGYLASSPPHLPTSSAQILTLCQVVIVGGDGGGVSPTVGVARR